jgi:hypothetical protein
VAELAVAVAVAVVLVAVVAVRVGCRWAEDRLIRRRIAEIADPVVRADAEAAYAEWGDDRA